MSLVKAVLSPFKFLWAHRRILWQTTRNDIKSRFAGSVLGLAWLFLYPLFLLGAYALVYVYVFKVRFGMLNSSEYVALIFCGLIPFLGFSESLGNGIPSVTANANLIKNTLFPIELIPVKAVLVSQSTQVAGTVLLLIALAAMGKLTVWALLVVPVWILQVMFTVGLIWVLSSLNVYFRDLQNIISVIVLFLMMVSPIAYTADMVPEGVRPLLAGNPLYYIITAYQDILMMGRLPKGGTGLVLVLMALGQMLFGYWFFSRMKRVFSDNV